MVNNVGGRSSGALARVVAVKTTVNYFPGSALKSLIVLGLGLTLLDIGFLAASACLGLLAAALEFAKMLGG